MAEGQVNGQGDTVANTVSEGEILQDLRAPMETAARDCLATTLERAADSLFDRAQREKRAAIRESCLAAVRALYQDRDGVKHRFQVALRDAFDRSLDVASAGAGGAPRASAAEDEAIIQATADRVRRYHAHALNELRLRLAPLLGCESTGDGQPFGPETLVRAFAEALRGTRIELRPRLLVYRGFEKALLDSLGPVLDQLNAELAAAGFSSDERSAEASPGPGSATSATSQVSSVASGSAEGSRASWPSTDSDAQPCPGVDAKKRVTAVRRMVVEAVETRLRAESAVGEVPCRFLRQAWSHVMVVAGIRYGVGGEVWCHQLRLMEWLVRSFRPAAEGGDQAAEAQFPALLERLRTELLYVTSDGDLVSNLIRHLRVAHAQASGGQEPATPSASARTAAPGASGDNVVVAQFDKDGGESQADSDVLRELARTPLGSWFAFEDEQGVRSYASLQALYYEGQRYIFADRRGNRVADYSADELAHAIADGWAAPVDESALGGRADGQGS